MGRFVSIGGWIATVALLLGGLAVGVYAHETYRRVRESAGWPATSATVVHLEPVEYTSSPSPPGSGGNRAASASDSPSSEWRAMVTFRYAVDGRPYEQRTIAYRAPEREAVDSYVAEHPVGSDFGPVYYDPMDPDRYVERRGGSPVTAALLHLASVALFAVGVLVLTILRSRPLAPAESSDPSRAAAAYEARARSRRGSVIIAAVSLAAVELLAIAAFELLGV